MRIIQAVLRAMQETEVQGYRPGVSLPFPLCLQISNNNLLLPLSESTVPAVYSSP
jgi:hypothetical protein